MMRQVPYFLCTTPRGKHWRLLMGGDRKGPAVWPFDTSLARAAEVASG